MLNLEKKYYFDEYNEKITIYSHNFEKSYNQENEKLEVIGSACICNTASMNIYKLENDYVIAGINNFKPEICEVEYSYSYEEEEDQAYFITKKGSDYYLNEFMRV